MTDEQESHKSFREWLSNVLLREPKDRDELMDIIHEAEQNKLLDKDAKSMIEGVFEVAKMQARDVMVPRSQMVIIDAELSPQDAVPIITEATHSRYPVTSEGPDKVIGILLAKDLLQFLSGDKKREIKIKEIMRPATFIPESKRLDVLLKEFRLKHNHMAIVVDEYGGVAGFVTIEDVLEQIVGEIEDEFDTEQEPNIDKIGDNKYLVKALTEIEEINAYFDTKFDDEDCDTIGGLVINEFGHLPKQGESIVIPPLEIKVIEATNRGIHLLRVIKLDNHHKQKDDEN